VLTCRYPDRGALTGLARVSVELAFPRALQRESPAQPVRAPFPHRGPTRRIAAPPRPIGGHLMSKTGTALAAIFIAWATQSNALEIASFSVAFHGQFPEQRYVADAGFDIDPRTLFDDEWVFGRGDAVKRTPSVGVRAVLSRELLGLLERR